MTKFFMKIGVTQVLNGLIRSLGRNCPSSSANLAVVHSHMNSELTAGQLVGPLTADACRQAIIKAKGGHTKY